MVTLLWVMRFSNGHGPVSSVLSDLISLQLIFKAGMLNSIRPGYRQRLINDGRVSNEKHAMAILLFSIMNDFQQLRLIKLIFMNLSNEFLFSCETAMSTGFLNSAGTRQAPRDLLLAI
jgi:hypothetical protein